MPVSDPGGYAGKGATASVTVTPAGLGAWTVTVTAGGANPNYPNTSPQPGSGPFQGRAVINLGAINPGSASKVQVTGQIQNAAFCQSEGGGQVCTSADGVIVVSDSQGKTIESGSLYLGDPNALGPAFSVTADSSCSSVVQPTAQCPQPGPVGIRVSLTEAAVAAPSPAVFSVKLTIQFVNQ